MIPRSGPLRQRYERWQAKVPGSDIWDSREQRLLDSFWEYARSELIEATDLDDALDMAAWDLGYQGQRLPAALLSLARLRQVHLEAEYRRGQQAGADNAGSRQVSAAQRRQAGASIYTPQALRTEAIQAFRHAVREKGVKARIVDYVLQVHDRGASVVARGVTADGEEIAVNVAL